MIRTLITDDSPLVRDILRDFFESEVTESGEPVFEIIAEAENGQDAINKTQELKPDLVTMDIEMPVMNGLDAIEGIRKFSSCGIVVITTVDTAKMAYDATVRGAHEFFAKDMFTSKMTDETRKEIIDTLKQIVQIKPAVLQKQSAEQTVTTAPRKINAVVIAASTGGPMALCQLFAQLPADFPVPIFLVQHNTSGFDKGFVQWLDGYSQLRVLLAEEGVTPESGTVYASPTDKHFVIKNNKIAFDDSEPVHNQKPAADLLFKSAADLYKDSLISVVLTGMGCDGAEGTRAVKEAGGITISQDEATSMIYGMPAASIETGCVDIVLPLNEIAQKLISLVNGD